VPSAGRYLAFEQDGRRVVVPLSREWTRIGRSLAADVRFDDATVSRRHALVAVEEGGVRVLDDRSLNGIQVNGRRVEWSPLTDGDELVIGRHALYFLDTVAAPATAEPAALAE
jgi:pSer/pThr/pTyr-binding forkhead associated (FHA) protein